MILVTPVLNQLLAVTHEIHSSFHSNFEFIPVFVDISKIFHTVWHEEIIHKLVFPPLFRNTPLLPQNVEPHQTRKVQWPTFENITGYVGYD